MSGLRPGRIWMDQGGTFTDVVRPSAGGGVVLEKRLSSDADLARLAEGDAGARRGTTAATNALLEGQGQPVLLLTSAGLEDIERIGDGRRSHLFSLDPAPRRVLATHSVGIPGRVLACGRVERAVDLVAARAAIETARRTHGVDAAAVVLVHGPQAPEEELKLARLCREMGMSQVSVGHETAPSEGFLARVQTTVLDASLSPLLPRIPGLYMRSDGGLAPHDSADWRGCHGVLSGPAGGVVAAAALLAAIPQAQLAFTLDMGGTSTDTACVGDRVRRSDTLTVDGLTLRVPAVELHTVAAGGGSCLRVVGGLFRVGPGSAGARPGPACYGRGGPATVTDCEAILGRLPGFPAVCGPAGDQALDVDAARAAVHALDPHRSVEAVAEDFRAVAHATMAGAVDAIAAARGLDPRDGVLIAFGGAGPAHATGVARTLGIRRVIIPHLAGGFSAVGIGIAGRRHEQVLPLNRTPLAQALTKLRAPFPGRRELRLGARIVGTSPILELPVDLAELRAATGLAPSPAPPPGGLPLLAPGPLRDRFDALHAAELGFSRPALPVELVELRCATEEPPRPLPLSAAATGEGPGDAAPKTHPPKRARAWFGGPCDVPVVDIHDTARLTGLRGPALVQAPGSTVVIEPGWTAHPRSHCLELVDSAGPPTALGTIQDSRETAIFASRVVAVADRMGARLARLSRSVSIREREDFSCAIFDPDGGLVANAPHVPVHLGAMGETLRQMLAPGPLPQNSMWLGNDPYRGGSHLPDLTVMAPVHDEAGRTLGFVGCRAHHVDIGGTHAGSMPPSASHIDEEGVVITRHPILLDGRLQLPALPGCREPEVVRADLEAQIASCAAGMQQLRSLAQEFGREGFLAQLGHLQGAAAAATQAALAAWATPRRSTQAEAPTEWRGQEVLDDGTRIGVQLRHADERLHVHVEAPAHPGNRNAPRAVARAVLLFVLRCLQDHDLPMNDGVMRMVRLTVDRGGLFDPSWPRAVAGGNVETSQRLADALVQALELGAASQGTMNNLTVSTPRGSWYETIAGGAGAGPGRAGRHACQVHMTNTRNTDVEVLERRFPVVVRRLAIRQGSGGAGRWPGGDGLEKVWEFRDTVQVAMMAERRRVGAPGGQGGGRGKPGRDDIRESGTWRPLQGTATLAAGDCLRVRTPGGGGWGQTGGPSTD